MLVQVKTRELIDQLPKQLRYDLIASFVPLPEFIVFRTAVPYTKPVKRPSETRRERLQEEWTEIPGVMEKYPHVAKELSVTQWRIFSLIQRPEGATRNELKALVSLSYVSDNLICSHLSALRRRFKAKGLPFDIESLRATGFNPTAKYKLVML